MSFVRTLLQKLLPERNSGKLRINITKEKNPTYMFYSDNRPILDDLSKKLGEYLTHPITGEPKKPVVWTITSLVPNSIGDNKYHLSIGAHIVEKAFKDLKLKFTEKNIRAELEKNGAVLDGGHKEDDSDKLEINFKIPPPLFLFDKAKLLAAPKAGSARYNYHKKLGK